MSWLTSFWLRQGTGQGVGATSSGLTRDSEEDHCIIKGFDLILLKVKLEEANWIA